MLSTPPPLQHLPGVQFKQWASYCDIFYVALKVAKKRERASHGTLYWENSLERGDCVKSGIIRFFALDVSELNNVELSL